MASPENRENSHRGIEKAVKVLIVEDDPSDAKLVRSTLSVSVQRYEAEVADCISTAIERLKASTFDVILLDMGLPDSQGIDTVSKVHNEYPDIPIVVLTGLDDDETGIRAVQIGAQDYLVKGSVSSNLMTKTIRYAIERKRTEDALKISLRQLKESEEKLQLVGSLTRHDAGNELFLISGFAQIAMHDTKDEVIQGYLQKIVDAVEVAQNVFAFSKEYQELGVEEPRWREMSASCDVGMSNIKLDSITLINDLGGLEIFTDSLIEKVFYNLADNTIRHGCDEVTEIRVFYEEVEKGLLLIYADDGVGVQESEKEVIFERGYGANTGYGLDLIRKTLEISGMDIKETGEPGKGVRFEISVPKDRYRVLEQE